eukprot:767807-Hanusia_phi.AAC.1
MFQAPVCLIDLYYMYRYPPSYIPLCPSSLSSLLPSPSPRSCSRACTLQEDLCAPDDVGSGRAADDRSWCILMTTMLLPSTPQV